MYHTSNNTELHRQDSIKANSWHGDESSTSLTIEDSESMYADDSESYFLGEYGLPNMEVRGCETGYEELVNILSELRGLATTEDDAQCVHEDDPKRAAEKWNELGLIRLHMQGNALEAIKCFHQALRVLYKEPIRTDARNNLVITLNDVSLCYMRLSKIEDAKRSNNEAYQICKNQGTPEDNIHYKSTLRIRTQLSFPETYSPSSPFFEEKRRRSAPHSRGMPTAYM